MFQKWSLKKCPNWSQSGLNISQIWPKNVPKSCQNLVDNDTLHALETDDFGKINSEILNVFYEPCVPPEAPSNAHFKSSFCWPPRNTRWHQLLVRWVQSYEGPKIPEAVVVISAVTATCWVVICCCWVPVCCCWEVSGTCWKVDGCCCWRSWQWTFLVLAASITNRIIDRYWVLVITVEVILANFCKKKNNANHL